MLFKEGMTVQWDKILGTVDFISEHYITICVSVKEQPDSEHARHKSNRCCVLCFPQDWDNVIILGNK